MLLLTLSLLCSALWALQHQLGPCGTCPCNGASCTNNSDCCATAQNWTLGNASVCVGGGQGCIMCGTYGDNCLFDAQCRCINANSSCDQGTSTCIFDTPDAPCGFCPCSGQACANNSQCCDPTQFGFGNASFCSAGTCATCVAPGDNCNIDAECQCNGTTQYVCSGGSCQLATAAPTHAPTAAPIGCTNTSQCPYGFYCNPFFLGCFNCESESFFCCNTSADCPSGQYCSPTFLVCILCSGLGQSCQFDPTSECACDNSTNLVCDNTTELCVQGGTPPTASPTCAPTQDPVNGQSWAWILFALAFLGIALTLCGCCGCCVAAADEHRRRKKKKKKGGETSDSE